MSISCSADQSRLWVAGVDGCRGGWVAFHVDTRTRKTQVEVVDLKSLLCNRPSDLAILAIDMPIGLLDGPRPCDCAARKFLGSPRCSSVFAAPCRAALTSSSHAMASETNHSATGKGLSIQAWAIAPKIKEIDDLLEPQQQSWVFEVHPEVSFWRMNGRKSMALSKSRQTGRQERRSILL
jgi:predicted RNase H-like nuclease